MEVYSTGEILKEKLQQRAKECLPLLKVKHGEHVWVEIRRYWTDEGAEYVGAMLHIPAPETVEAGPLPRGVIVRDELAGRRDLLHANVRLTREKVLHQALLQVVRQEGNAALLERCPHVDLLDLAGIFYLPLKLGGKLDGFGRLQWRDLDEQGITLEELYVAARENTVLRQGVRVVSEAKMAEQTFKNGRWIGTTLGKAQMARRNCYVVSNRAHSGGGALILVPEVLEALEKKLGGPFFIAFTVVDGLMTIKEDREQYRPEHAGLALRVLQYWPSGLSDRLYRFDRDQGLQFAS